MESATVTFDLIPTNQPLQVQVRFDGKIVLDKEVEQQESVYFDFNDDDAGEHCLEIELLNKTQDHTILNSDGQIIDDSSILIENIALDDIPLGYIATQTATYTHDNNGSGVTVVDAFYSEIGCNGVVQLKFTSPVYLWLLEKNKY